MTTAWSAAVEAVARHSRCRVSPNAITGFRAGLVCLAFVCAWKGCALGAFLLFAVAIFLDDVDGCVARRCHSATKFGANFDQGVDAAAVLLAYGCLLLSWKSLPVGAGACLSAMLLLQTIFWLNISGCVRLFDAEGVVQPLGTLAFFILFVLAMPSTEHGLSPVPVLVLFVVLLAWGLQPQKSAGERGLQRTQSGG